MDKAQYDRAKEIIASIKGVDERISKNESFVDRLAKLDEGNRHIRMSDDEWTYTPTAVVNSTNLAQFVKTEIHSLELQRKSLEDEFSRL